MESISRIVKSEPFHVQAYVHIQNYLLENKFLPGERLTESGLANMLGVSRGPIREAIRMLIHDGLLTQKGVHIYVFDPTVDDVVDLYLCKERLEPLGAKLSAQNMSQVNKDALIEIVNNTKKALENNQKREVVTFNTKFHDIVVQSSGNKQLIQFMNLIHAKNLYMRNNILSNYSRRDNFFEEHVRIADAIVNGNGNQAELEMKQHVQNDINMLDTIFKSKQKDDFI
ncbi:GntR family transcriptional regulator [Virgibacillus necropolis]|uniref:GntR family transcriptional regulator n=1 Tax=Virgibacillus necropolis TaxID=163877 RepID=UPI0013747D2F|nr:GntR family transcriptional regulator [Virgibacillus necropolis]